MSCQDVKAVIIRPGVCRFKAEIQFNPTTYAFCFGFDRVLYHVFCVSVLCLLRNCA